MIDRLFDLQKNSIKVHYFDFADRWDEYFEDKDIHKLAPYLTFAEEPKNKIF